MKCYSWANLCKNAPWSQVRPNSCRFSMEGLIGYHGSKKLGKHKLDMECILINRIVIVRYYMNIHIWSESSTKL